jgi:hypothetical protein
MNDRGQRAHLARDAADDPTDTMILEASNRYAWLLGQSLMVRCSPDSYGQTLDYLSFSLHCLYRAGAPDFKGPWSFPGQGVRSMDVVHVSRERRAILA